ncbi:MAG: OmpW family outer membrane protein [Acidobacteriota bacterium]
MRKNWIINFTIIIALLSAPNLLAGQGKKAQTLGPLLFYQMPAETSLNGSLGLGVIYDFFLKPAFSISGVLGRTSIDKDEEKSSGGDIGMTSVEISALYHWKGKGKLVPYAGGGIGYYKTDFDSDSPLKDLGFQVERSFDNFGFNARGGLDFHIKNKVWLSAELKYLVLDGSEEEIADAYSGESIEAGDAIDLNSLYLNFGVKFLF